MRVAGKLVMMLLLVVSVATVPALGKSTKGGFKEAIQKVLDTQAEAWNRGDLANFMTGYLKSPDISYTSGGAVVWGYDAIEKRFAKAYGTNSSAMGKLSFSDLRIVEVSKDSAFCVGQFHLVKSDGSNAEGVFSLVFKRTSSGWKIVHDHTTAGIKKDE